MYVCETLHFYIITKKIHMFLSDAMTKKSNNTGKKKKKDVRQKRRKRINKNFVLLHSWEAKTGREGWKE